jgi:putative colanic acid polymerase
MNTLRSTESSSPGLDRVTASVLFVGLLGLHLQFTTILGYPLTVAPVCVLLLALLSTISAKRRIFPVLSSLLLAAPVVIYFVHLDNVDPTQFVRTFALYGFTLLALVSFFGRQPTQVIRSGPVLRALQFVLVIVVSLSVFQVLMGLRGSSYFFNPFRSHQYLYQYEPGLTYAFPRAEGFYLEPAFNALVIIAVGCTLIILEHHPTRNIVLMTLGVATSGSASGLLTLTIVLLIFGLLRRTWQGCLAMLAIGSVAMFSGDYVVGRLTSVGEIGSSANYRLEAPRRMLQDVLSMSPFGSPLGSIETTLSHYSLANGSAIGKTLDNGYYVLVFYFGLLGIVMAALFASYCIALARRQSRLSLTHWPFGLSLIALPLFTGGIILPEFLLPFGLLLLASRAASQEWMQQCRS